MIQIRAHIHKALASAPDTSPGRHEAIINITLQLVGEGIPDGEIFGLIRDRWPIYLHPDKTDREIRDAIAGAHRRNPKPSATGNRSNYQHDHSEIQSNWSQRHLSTKRGLKRSPET